MLGEVSENQDLSAQFKQIKNSVWFRFCCVSRSRGRKDVGTSGLLSAADGFQGCKRGTFQNQTLKSGFSERFRGF